MVGYCGICKSTTRSTNKAGIENPSHHRMPTNIELRNIWMSLLGLNPDTPISKNFEICSKHFEQSDFVLTSDGKRKLKPGALPLSIHSLFDKANGDWSSSSSTSSVSSSASAHVDEETRQEIKISNEEELSLEQEKISLSYSTLESSPVRKRFPSKKEERNVWFAVLEIDKSILKPKVPYLCSTHFEESDYYYKADGKKYLKRGAVPKMIDFTASSSSSSLSAEVISDEKSNFLIGIKSLPSGLPKDDDVIGEQLNVPKTEVVHSPNEGDTKQVNTEFNAATSIKEEVVVEHYQCGTCHSYLEVNDPVDLTKHHLDCRPTVIGKLSLDFKRNVGDEGDQTNTEVYAVTPIKEEVLTEHTHYQCESCHSYLEFNDPDDLTKHRLECQPAATDKWSFEFKRKIKDGGEPTNTEFCATTSIKEDTHSHYQCGSCHSYLEFNNGDDLTKHRLECRPTATGKGSFAFKRKIEDVGEQTNTEFYAATSIKEELDKDDRVKCDYKLVNQESDQNELKPVAAVESSNNSTISSPRGLRRRRQENIENFIYVKPPKLKTDKVLRTKSALYSCSKCRKTFDNGTNLTRHLESHNSEKPFTCKLCGKCFTQKGILNVHTKVHAEKPYVCTECRKSFATQNDLDDHLKFHTGETEFICHQCGQSFPKRCGLMVHLKIHTGGRRFNCKKCGKKFLHRGHFNLHLRSHTVQKPYKCEFCEEKFVNDFSLKEHAVVHTEDKYFECYTCGSCFNLKKNLRIHLKIHTGRKVRR